MKVLIQPIMILQRSNNKGTFLSKVRLLQEPYLFINLFLAGIILLVFAYSALFSPVTDNYPVVCVHEKLTGEPCASCGLSHSFSLIIRGEFSEAREWNAYGMRVFIFFAAQLLLRIVFSVYYIKNPLDRRSLIITDSIGSAIMFIIAFMPYLRWIASAMFPSN